MSSGGYKKSAILCGLIIVMMLMMYASIIHAQYALRIQVNDFTGNHDIYLAGNINNWNPADNRYKFKPVYYFRKEIVLPNLSAGRYEFKLTRGSWKTEAATPEGYAKAATVIELKHDTTILIAVQSWKDDNRDTAHFTNSQLFNISMNKAVGYLNINLDSAFKYAMDTYRIGSEANDPDLKAKAISILGEIFVKLGNNSKALELFEDGLNIRRSMNDSGAIVFLYNQVADVYLQMKDTVKAVENCYAAVPWIPGLLYVHPLHEVICNVFCIAGTSALNKGDIDSAKWYANKSAAVGDKISPVTDLLYGDIQLKAGNAENAIKWYRNAVEHSIDHDYDIVMQAYLRMAKLFIAYRQNDSALVYAKKAFITANEMRDNIAVATTGKMLAELFIQLNENDSAIIYQQQLIALMQSQLIQEKERQSLGTFFETKLEGQELAAQARHNKTMWFLYGLIAFIILMTTGAFYYRYRMRAGYTRKMKETEMRALRAQMNPHFIFNCLTSINRYIVKSDHKTASNYLTKFSRLIRMILDNSANDYISLETELQTLQLYMDMELLRFDNAFEYVIEKDETIDTSAIQIPSMLIQPYIENAIWHGLLHKETKGKLNVRLMHEKTNILKVEIEDDGIGRGKARELRSKDVIKNKSYGMQISSDRIKLINSLYNIETSVHINDLVDPEGNAAGTQIIIEIPFLQNRFV